MLITSLCKKVFDRFEYDLKLEVKKSIHPVTNATVYDFGVLTTLSGQLPVL